MKECRAFIELRRYIEECVIGGTFLFKLNEMHSLYVERLKDFRHKEDSKQNKTESKTFGSISNSS